MLPSEKVRVSDIQKNVVNLILWLVIGGVLGWLASIVMKTDAQQGIFLNVIVGIVGAFLAGFFITPLLGTGTISGGDQESGGSLMEMGRPFLNDGDEIVMRGRAGKVELGEVSGKIEPART